MNTESTPVAPHLQGTAIYAGSFDPVTYGHLDLIRRASRLFGDLVIAVGNSPKKKYLFDLEERVSMLQGEISELTNVKVLGFHGLLINFAQEVGANVIVRGLRAATDFEYEFQIGLVNMDMNPKIETLFLLTNPQNIFISSSTAKEIAYFGGELERYVPPSVAKQLQSKYPQNNSETSS